ncbi:MAG: nuclease, partial [Frankiales bacterium]|nr:nuclease [Frankiales bacterium]
RAQRLGDALVQLADLQLASGKLPMLRGVRPHIGVLIGIEDLVHPAPGPGAATTTMGSAISAARARMLACDGDVTRIVIGPDSVPLDLGRTQRIAPPHLRRAVVLRDTTCVFTGCQAPAWWCEVHHVLHWGDGGETSLENSAHP